MDAATELDVHNRFDYHPATTDERRREHEKVRAECLGLAMYLRTQVPAGREQALALTNVEEAMFWANAAIARQE